MEFDAGVLDVALEKVAIDEGRSNRQAGRYAYAPQPQPPPHCLVRPQAIARVLETLPAIRAHGG
jgi:hypothetical protein